MRRQDLIFLIIALVAGFFAFILVAAYLKKASVPKVRVVSIVQDAKKGEILSPAHIALSKPVQGIQEDDFFLQTADVVGMQTLVDLHKGELLGRQSVKALPQLDEVDSKELPIPIPEGLRALTLSTQEIENLPEYFKVGSYVDILGNITTNDGRTELQTIIRGAQVISVNRMTELVTKEKKIAYKDLPIKNFTLALDPEGIEVITKAIQKGKVRLIIRPDGTQQESLRIEGVKYTEIIRGIEKEKVMRNEDRYGKMQGWMSNDAQRNEQAGEAA